jgi:crossover junction endodeoxyribonuclease RusA
MTAAGKRTPGEIDAAHDAAVSAYARGVTDVSPYGEVPASAWDVDVFVPGAPVPKGSAKAFVNPYTRRAAVTQTNAKAQREWAPFVRDSVGQGLVYQSLGAWPTAAPVAVMLDFVMPRRKSAPKTYTPAWTRKPDLDKLIRMVLDCLTHVALADDAQVTSVAGSKREAEPGEEPGVRIRLAALPERAR